MTLSYEKEITMYGRTVLKLTIFPMALALAACAAPAAKPASSDDLAAAVARAQATADEALQKANEAQQTANNAQKTANDAKAMCTAAESRCSRMFEKSQQK